MAMSAAMRDQTKREESKRQVALIPGGPREWTCSTTFFWKERGTKGRKMGVETSLSKESSGEVEQR